MPQQRFYPTAPPPTGKPGLLQGEKLFLQLTGLHSGGLPIHHNIEGTGLRAVGLQVDL
jgi:hypothetical protein